MGFVNGLLSHAMFYLQIVLSRAPCPLDSVALGSLHFFYSLCYVCYIRTRKCVNIKHGQKMSDCIAIFDKHSVNWKFR